MASQGLRCPHCGSLSADAEFCSECGAAMTQTAGAPAGGTPDTPELCPVCGEVRPGPFARYCDNCRYDFLSKQKFGAGPVPTAQAAPPPLPAVTPAVFAVMRWDLHGSVDVSLRRPEDPMPSDQRPRIYPLDLADHLIGRRSDSEDIHPEIAIGDPGISRRHARILRAADGALSLLDLGSMNGTRLNGTAVEPNVATPLASGDQVTLGCWTRLVVTPR